MSLRMGLRVSAENKRVAGGRFRPKPGKTRCLSRSADSKGVSIESAPRKTKTPAKCWRQRLQPELLLNFTLPEWLLSVKENLGGCPLGSARTPRKHGSELL